jgi:hypothetical protein
LLGDAVGGLDPVDDVEEDLLPHLEGSHWGAVGAKTGEKKMHYFPVKTGHHVALKLALECLCGNGDHIMKHFGQGGILTFSARFPELAVVE